jgi:hypothetical protein
MCNDKIKSKNLQLSLKKQWFDMTDVDGKTEDYRDITPYWCNRLILVEGKSKSKEWWESRYEFFYFNSWFLDNIDLGNFDFKHFDYNVMTLGYPSKSDVDRFKIFKHEGIEIRTGNPLWGAEPNKLYFVIKHGKKI